MKLMEHKRHWTRTLVSTLVAIPCVWKGKYLMLVLGPTAADLVVLGSKMVSNADIEAAAEPGGAGGTEVGMDLVKLGCQRTSSTQVDAHALQDLVQSVCFLRWSRRRPPFIKYLSDALISVIEFEYGESWRAGDLHKFFF